MEAQSGRAKETYVIHCAAPRQGATPRPTAAIGFALMSNIGLHAQYYLEWMPNTTYNACPILLRMLAQYYLECMPNSILLILSSNLVWTLKKQSHTGHSKDCGCGTGNLPLCTVYKTLGTPIQTDQVKAMIPYWCHLLNPLQISVDEGEETFVDCVPFRGWMGKTKYLRAFETEYGNRCQVHRFECVKSNVICDMLRKQQV